MSIKKPDKLMGYVELDNEEYPFEFDEDSFSVILFPATREKWNDATSPNEWFNLLTKKKDFGWIKSKKIEGITSERYKIIFYIKDAPSYYHGFLTYEVGWYYFCKDYFEFDKIQGFKLYGKEIDYFYPPTTVLSKDIQYDDKYNLKSMSVKTVDDIEAASCGEYVVCRHLKAKIEVTAFATMYFNDDKRPIEVSSFMKFDFSRPADLEELVIAFRHVDCFLKYITYRNNTDVHDAVAFLVTDDGRWDAAGMWVFPENKPENNKKAHERILGYSTLGSKTARILTTIKGGKIGYPHICDSIDDMRHYSPGRMIMIMAEFEREFRNIYGTDYGRSDGYRNTKEEVVEMIEQYRRLHTGETKKHANSIKKFILNTDNSYAANVEHAMNDCIAIMRPFVLSRYQKEPEKVIKDISARVGEIRNGIAHSKLDFKLDAIHLNDTKIIEELNYAIRLKKIGVEKRKIQEGIKALFNENVAL